MEYYLRSLITSVEKMALSPVGGYSSPAADGRISSMTMSSSFDDHEIWFASLFALLLNVVVMTMVLLIRRLKLRSICNILSMSSLLYPFSLLVREALYLYHLLLFVLKAEFDQNSKARQHRDYLIHLFLTYYRSSGFSERAERGFNLFSRLFVNVLLLWRTHQVMFADKTDYALAATEQEKNANMSAKIPPLTMARRIMKMATSSYGVNAVAATQMKDQSKPVRRLNCLQSSEISTRSSFPHHIDHIQEQDVIHVWHESSSSLQHCCNHALILDHRHREVVIAIRGSSSILDVFVDLKGISVPFCGGLAHWGVLDVARGVLAKVEHLINDPTIVPPTYELIVTGHSSGGMAASLLTVLLLAENATDASPPRLRFNRPVRCLAFGATPSFFPLHKIAHVLPHITAYTTCDDAITSAGYHPMYRLHNHLEAVNEFRKKSLYILETIRIVLGISVPPQELVEKCWRAERASRTDIRGMAPLQIVCSNLIWMDKASAAFERKGRHQDRFLVRVCDPERFRQRGLVLSPSCVTNHLMAAYEQALDALVRQEEEEEHRRPKIVCSPKPQMHNAANIHSSSDPPSDVTSVESSTHSISSTSDQNDHPSRDGDDSDEGENCFGWKGPLRCLLAETKTKASIFVPGSNVENAHIEIVTIGRSPQFCNEGCLE